MRESGDLNNIGRPRSYFDWLNPIQKIPSVYEGRGNLVHKSVLAVCRIWLRCIQQLLTWEASGNSSRRIPIVRLFLRAASLSASAITSRFSAWKKFPVVPTKYFQCLEILVSYITLPLMHLPPRFSLPPFSYCSCMRNCFFCNRVKYYPQR